MDRDREETLTELLKWRNLLPGWKFRTPPEYCEELRWLCAWGHIAAHGRSVVRSRVPERPQPPRLVPPKAFDDVYLVKGTNHGELKKRLEAPSHWVDLRFSNDTRRAWQAALEAGDLMASRAASVAGAEAAQPTLAARDEKQTIVSCTASPRRRHGPNPGKGLYVERDRALYPEIEEIMHPSPPGQAPLTLTAATRKLANMGKIEGLNSTEESLAARLRKRYQKDHPAGGTQ